MLELTGPPQRTTDRILVSSWLAQRFARKGLILFIFMMPVILGVGLLYGLPKTDQYQGGLLAGYCESPPPETDATSAHAKFLWTSDLFSFLFSANPLIVSWMGANVGGNSKKSAYYVSTLRPYALPPAFRSVYPAWT